MRTFLERGTVVTGIGIEGQALTDRLGLPSLYSTVWGPDQGYTTSDFYYIYSLSFAGNVEDVAKIDIDRYIEIMKAETEAERTDGILFSRWANSAGLIGNPTVLAAWTLIVLLLAADGLLLLRAAGYPVTGRWPLRILALRTRHWDLGIAVVVLMVVALLIGPLTCLLLWLWN